MLRADLAQYYPAKALFERVLGRSAFLRVKDYGPLSSWRKNYDRLLRAIGVAAAATVEVADAEWYDDGGDGDAVLVRRARWRVFAHHTALVGVIMRGAEAGDAFEPVRLRVVRMRKRKRLEATGRRVAKAALAFAHLRALRPRPQFVNP